MNNTGKIWVLTETFETRALYAELDETTLRTIAELIFRVLEDEDDPDAPKSVEEVITLITDELATSENQSADFNIYTLSHMELEGMGEDDSYKIERGCRVYEAANRITMGCDMAYVLSPIGYFAKKPDEADDFNIEWIERVVE